jgi:hypothetical protein
MASTPARSADRTAAWIAAATAMLMIAQQIAGKATRDAYFLSVHGIEDLPKLFIFAAVTSITLVPLASRWLTRLGPARMVPRAFVGSAALLVGIFFLSLKLPSVASVVLYLQIAAVNGILISWFWSLVNERFDPRTARREMRRLMGGAALGGLVGGVVAERAAVIVGVSWMLLVLAAMHLGCGLAALALRGRRRTPAAAGPAPSGFAVLRRSGYVRDLAALVILSTVAATLVDFVFKSGAAAMLDRGPSLMRFFAVFYAASGLATFVVQTFFGHLALTKLGIAPTVATLPSAVMAGSVVALLFPGMPAVVLLRGAEQALHTSLFRSGYELFFAPLPPGEKRSVKTLIDVGCDRLGDAVGGALLVVLVALVGGALRGVLLGVVIAVSAAVLWLTIRLQRGHRRSLERSLRARGGELGLGGDVDESTTVSVLRSFGDGVPLVSRPMPAVEPHEPSLPPSAPAPVDPLVERISALRSGDATRARRALAQAPLDAMVAPHAIPLLAWDEVAPEALAALRGVAASCVGQLVDALLSKGEEFAVRRRVPRVLEVIGGARVVDGLLRGLDDPRFEVRYRCGRALARIKGRNPDEPIDRERIHAAVLREARLGRGVWESQRLLDAEDESAVESSGQVERGVDFDDELLRERASRSLEHVFTLLSLASPKKPLVIAFRGLHTDDETLRGTALEYLESVLPPDVRAALWPYLEDRRGPQAPRTTKPREAVLDALMLSNGQINVSLQKIRGKPG